MKASSMLPLVGLSLLLCISDITAFTSIPVSFVTHRHPHHYNPMDIVTNNRRTMTPTTTTTTGRKGTSTTQRHAASYEICAQVGYSTKCSKPLGIVFGENPDPYLGVVVDDVSEGQNGGRAGLRVGDQLMAINGQVVVGTDLESVLTLFQSIPSRDVIDLVLFRGPVSTMYTILGNQMGEDEFVRDEDGNDEDGDGEEEIIMDENYESPVVIEVKPKKSLSPADFFKAAAKVGKMLLEDTTATTTTSADGGEAAPNEKKKNQGFFGIGAESIQLDGNDANTLK
jgi:PDZ domain